MNHKFSAVVGVHKGESRPRWRRLAAVLALAATAWAATEVAAAGPEDTGPSSAAPPAAGTLAYPKSRQEIEAAAKENPLEFLRTALRWHDERVCDYVCQFEKVERIGDELRKPETMRMKFRARPFSVYVKWLNEPTKGQEVIYVEGANQNKVVAHPGGLLGLIVKIPLKIDPMSKLALKHSRRPITNAGMGNMLRLIIPQCEAAQANNDLVLTYEGLGDVGGRQTLVFKRVLPQKHNYPCYVLLIYIDVETLMCVRTDAYDWNGDLISHYAYTQVQINTGLTDYDFDPFNRQYGYRLL